MKRAELERQRFNGLTFQLCFADKGWSREALRFSMNVSTRLKAAESRGGALRGDSESCMRSGRFWTSSNDGRSAHLYSSFRGARNAVPVLPNVRANLRGTACQTGSGADDAPSARGRAWLASRGASG